MKIIVIKDEKPIDQFVFSGQGLTIGRRSECDISIKDPAVSGNHARIMVSSGKYAIEDLGSTNGIYVRGKRINGQYLLANDDVVTIGEHRLKFVISGAPEVPVRPVAPTPASLSGQLRVLNGKNAGKVLPLEEGLTTVGEPGVQVAAISRRPQGHFIIHVDGGKDRERVPLVNGEPTGFKSRKLEHGDRIEVAGVLMEYVLPDGQD
ncbi:MAG: FHA domain-containing protein [Pseudomonadota bacterium]